MKKASSDSRSGARSKPKRKSIAALTSKSTVVAGNRARGLKDQIEHQRIPGGARVESALHAGRVHRDLQIAEGGAQSLDDIDQFRGRGCIVAGKISLDRLEQPPAKRGAEVECRPERLAGHRQTLRHQPMLAQGVAPIRQVLQPVLQDVALGLRQIHGRQAQKSSVFEQLDQQPTTMQRPARLDLAPPSRSLPFPRPRRRQHA
jgi:hypothetical protein